VHFACRTRVIHAKRYGSIRGDLHRAIHTIHNAPVDITVDKGGLLNGEKAQQNQHFKYHNMVPSLYRFANTALIVMVGTNWGRTSGSPANVTLLWNMHRSGAACSLNVTSIGICLYEQHYVVTAIAHFSRRSMLLPLTRPECGTIVKRTFGMLVGPRAEGFSGDLMNLPNSLTTLRIFFVPLLVVVLLTRQPNFDFWGLPIHFEVLGVLILLMAAATDMMDGYLARTRKEITTLGILLDPIADKLLISAAFISLVEMGLMQAWMVVIIIGREFMVMGLREIASVEGLIIPASPLGKVKMILQVLAGCTVILTANHPALKLVGTVLLWMVVVSAVASAGHYFQMFWTQINFRVQQRRRGALLVKPEEKPQDVLTR